MEKRVKAEEVRKIPAAIKQGIWMATMDQLGEIQNRRVAFLHCEAATASKVAVKAAFAGI